MSTDSPLTLHATTVAINGRAVMLTGPSGAGKSDLALRLIDRGAVLISDDYTVIEQHSGVAVASPPATIAGRIEVRALGIVSVPFVSSIPVDLLVSVADEMERMPEPGWYELAGCRVRTIVIDPRPASAPIKVEWALQQMTRGDAA